MNLFKAREISGTASRVKAHRRDRETRPDLINAGHYLDRSATEEMKRAEVVRLKFTRGNVLCVFVSLSAGCPFRCVGGKTCGAQK